MDDEDDAQRICSRLNNKLIESNTIKINMHPDSCPIKKLKRPVAAPLVDSTPIKIKVATKDVYKVKCSNLLHLISSMKYLSQKSQIGQACSTSAASSTSNSDSSKKSSII